VRKKAELEKLRREREAQSAQEAAAAEDVPSTRRMLVIRKPEGLQSRADCMALCSV